MNDLIPTIPAHQSPFDAIRQVRDDGTEYWSARELMRLERYTRWENFKTSMGRAATTANSQGHATEDHFHRTVQKVDIGSGASREVEDFHLSRFGAYLTAMNGDPNMPEVAAAQAYFAVRTREAETAPAPRYVIPQTMSEALRLAADEMERAELAESKVAELEPAARAWGHMVEAGGSVAVGDAAKALSDRGATIGRQRLFEQMAEWGWIFRAGTRDREAWRAYQHQIECGRLVEKLNPSFLNRKTGEYEIAAPTIRVTTKGLDEMYRRLTIKAVSA